jgi:hypothetical protein
MTPVELDVVYEIHTYCQSIQCYDCKFKDECESLSDAITLLASRIKEYQDDKSRIS